MQACNFGVGAGAPVLRRGTKVDSTDVTASRLVEHNHFC